MGRPDGLTTDYQGYIFNGPLLVGQKFHHLIVPPFCYIFLDVPKLDYLNDLAILESAEIDATPGQTEFYERPERDFRR